MATEPAPALVMAPFGRDAAMLSEIVVGVGLDCRICPDAAALVEAAAEPFTLLLLTEEALQDGAAEALRTALGAQPDWSTAPVLALLDSAEDGIDAHLDKAGAVQVMVLQRPTQRRVLESAITTLAEVRARQHRIRDQLVALERQEAYQRFLLDELNHRVKNVLSNVQSIAMLTARRSDDLAGFTRTFSRRVDALARVHASMATAPDGRALLADIVEGALSPYAVDGSATIAIDGPEVALPPRAVTTLGMALHELATNAAKYCALSQANGRVAIDWTAGGGRLVLRWRESGGPPVEPPTRKSFGTQMIEDIVARELSGTVSLRFDRAGLAWDFSMPLEPPESA